MPYARELSKIQIRGNAWTWWKQAKGHYRRSRRPAVGSVLVLKHKGGSRGHSRQSERKCATRWVG